MRTSTSQMKGNKQCHQQQLKSEIVKMELSTWMLNLHQKSITKVLHTDLFNDSSNLLIHLRLRLRIRKERKQDLLSAMEHNWLCASEIANRAKVQHKSAIKLLVNMALTGEIEMTMHEWIDERMRQRKRRMYRKPSLSEVERAMLLNSCFGLKVVEPPNGIINARMHVLRG